MRIRFIHQHFVPVVSHISVLCRLQILVFADSEMHRGCQILNIYRLEECAYKTRNLEVFSMASFSAGHEPNPRPPRCPFTLAQASRARFGKKKMVRPPSSSVPASRPTSLSVSFGGFPAEAEKRSLGFGSASRVARRAPAPDLRRRDCFAALERRTSGAQASRTATGTRLAGARVLPGGRGAATRSAARDCQPYFRGTVRQRASFLPPRFSPTRLAHDAPTRSLVPTGP